MTTRKAWILYTVIRIGLFIAAYAIVWLLFGRWWIAVIIATLVSAAISILALDSLRSKASQGFAQWRARDRTEDSIIEDEMIDQDPSLLETSHKKDEE